MTAKPAVTVLLTQKAIDDLGRIFDYSQTQWGRKVADKYLGELEAGLERIRVEPGLIRSEPPLPDAICFYRVNRHLIVCDVQLPSIVVLAVIHASMDIPQRLAELQPQLATEVEMLHRSLRARNG